MDETSRRLISSLGVDAAEIEERKRFLGLSEADVARLRALRPLLQAHSASFSEKFYAHLRTFAPLRALLEDPATFARLRASQQAYFESLADGEYGPGRVEDRLRIGIAHRRVGLEHKWYLGAYCRYLTELLQIVCDSPGGVPPAEARQAYEALLKVVFLDMELALDTYVAAERAAVVQAQEARAASESQYRDLVETTSDWLWEVDANGVYTYASPKVRELLGYAPQEVLGKTPFDFMPPDEARRIRAIFAEIAAARRPFERLEKVNRHRDGRFVTLETSGVPIFDGQGQFCGYRGIDRDITARKRDETTRRLLAAALEQSADLVMIVDRQGLISYVNPALCAATGYTAEELIGSKPSVLKSGVQDADTYAELWRTILSGQPYQNVIINRRKDGSLYHEQKTITPLRDPASGYITHFVSTGKDISEALRLSERLNFLAFHDPLTGLANRARFLDLAGRALVQAARQRRACAVLYVDFDRFKVINETLGHGAGDQCLRGLGERLRERVRAMDSIARLGGDDFAVLLADLPGPETVPPIVTAVLEALKVPLNVGEREIFMSASVGISLYPDDGADVDTLLRNAEAAMYQAKRAGRGNYRFYSGELNARAQRRLELERYLHRALERKELRLYFQPQVALDSGMIVGLEALLRWQHPELGTVSPGEFIPVLEESGLIAPVGEWALRAACEQAVAWRAAGLPPVRVAVNLSGVQFHRRDLLAHLSAVLADTGIEPSALELEVTESVMLQDVDGALDSLRAINHLGVRLGIDDFGTGYSSLAYLKQVPLHTLKLAQPFVHGLPKDRADCGIARAVIAMARSLDLTVVAEGVETEEQLAFLVREGCHAIQGYLFCRPIPAEETAALLASGKRL